MQLTSEDLAVKDAEQKEAARARHLAARKAIEDEKAQHSATVAKETEEKKTELELLLGELPKGMQQTVRLEAYLHVLRHGYDHSQLQSSVDATTLRLARYMVSGDV